MKTIPVTKETAWAETGQGSIKLSSLFLFFIKKMESLGSACPWLGRAYFKFFYSSMVQRELSLSKALPGMKVLHIGCGPYPMTALFLASRGLMVTAVDTDEGVLDRARKTVAHHKLDHQIRITQGCGTSMKYSGYDFIWLSLHVSPMGRVVERALNSMDQDAGIIFRGPRGSLKTIYKETNPAGTADRVVCQEVSQPLGKKSVLLKKTPLKD
ncbi:class I SAM-dependent methyltransferase [Desulfonatronovibrio hydrogenovorans]|uniref:class I SAM-dependent methyltransferase n=1 Tax=Desulfonatronovibrio hydrogenovorans TaxID=53245 RepID=UPI00048EEDD0|nr:methyltransferase domain-containing protein [Desulfonatronovibrio hydrogenovorans]